MACPKSPTASRVPGAQGCAEGADEGCPFSCLLLFGHAKRSKSGRPKDGPKALALGSCSNTGQRNEEREPRCAGVGSRSDLRRLGDAAVRQAPKRKRPRATGTKTATQRIAGRSGRTWEWPWMAMLWERGRTDRKLLILLWLQVAQGNVPNSQSRVVQALDQDPTYAG
jgi:hypothetical protein